MRKDRFPVGWEIVRLGDVASVNSTSIKIGQEPEVINYVDIASVSTGQIDKSDAFYLRQNLQTKNANLRQTRDLLLPRLVGGEIRIEPSADRGAD